MSETLPDMTPVDRKFQQLLLQARALREVNEKLESASGLIAKRHSEEANRIAARMAWRPQASVAMLEEHTCRTCGHQTHVFRGFGVLMKRQGEQSFRIMATASPDEGLPFQRYILPVVTPACVECLPERGF